MIEKNYQVINQDCIDWMDSQSEEFVDCIVTSPPYNLDVKYGSYGDDLPRESYLKWLGDIAKSSKRILKDEGHFFLNVGYSNIDPWVAMDVAQVFREHFILQNNFTWVKHIAVKDKGYGQYKPITSNRFTSVTTESIFHFTKTGKVKVDRLSIGQRNKTHELYPELYSEGRHNAVSRRKISKRMKFPNYKDFLANSSEEQKEEFEKLLAELLIEKPFDPNNPKCIGNAWYIPYTPTSKLSKKMGAKANHNYREVSRGNHPATFPEQLPIQCIKFSGIPKESIVYDPFVGTGTTLVAALKQGMEAIGTDIDQEYCKFSSNRVKAEVPTNLLDFE